MDVLVERFQRRRIVSDKSSPMLYYLRQKPKTCGTVDIDVLAASIQKNCAMTKGDVKHVIEALVEEIQANLANGDKVKLNQLGTLHMTFRCPGVEKSEDCTVRNISKVNIRFVPDKELKLVNGSTAATRSPANVVFSLDKPADGSSSGGSGGNSGEEALSGCGEVGRLHGEEYLQSEYPLCARQGAEACERQYGCHPQPGKCGFLAGQACGRQFFRW